MENKIEKKASEVIITFTTSGEEWASAQKKEFNKLSAKLKVPGFRNGHVPENIARQRINPAEVLNEALYTVVNKAYRDVLTKEQLTVIAEPKLTVNKISSEELECVVTVALPPVVTLGEYKGIKIEKEEVVVTDEDVEKAIASELEKHGSLVLKEEEAKLGDTITIDFKGFIDNVPFEGGEAKSYDLKLGSNSFVPGFEDQLVGIKAGEEKTIDIKFPENYVESLAGKDAKFEVKCLEVKQTIIPELNEEFLEELDLKDIKTIDEYKEKVKNDLLTTKQRNVDTDHLNKIIETIIDNSQVEIAEGLIEDEAQAQIESIKKQVESNGLSFEDYLKINNIDVNKLLEDKKVEALKNIKGMLVIQEICNKENIVVDSKALTDKYEELAKLYNMKIEDVKKVLEPHKDEVLKNLKNELFSKFILANNE